MFRNRVLFRADLRGPEVIFEEGFHPRYTGGIIVHPGGQATGGISTTKELRIAMDYAARYGGYVYAVVASGVDILEWLYQHHATQGAKANAMTQMEIHCNYIEANKIAFARKAILVDGKLSFSDLLITNRMCIYPPEDLIRVRELFLLDGQFDKSLYQ